MKYTKKQQKIVDKMLPLLKVSRAHLSEKQRRQLDALGDQLRVQGGDLDKLTNSATYKRNNAK